MFRFQNFRYILLLFLLVMTALTYHPTFSNVVTFEKGDNPLMPYINILAVATFLLYFNYHNWLRNHTIRTYLVYMIICLVLGYFLLQMDISKRYDADARWVAMSFMFFAIGYNTRLSRNQLTFMLLLYAASVAYVSYLQMMQHSGGFIIVDQYLDYGKNTLGVMCAVSCIALLILSFQETNKYIKIAERALYLFVFVLCITIRARAAFLVIFLMTFYCIIKRMRTKRLRINDLSKVVFGGFFIVMIIIISPQIYHSLVDYVSSAFFQHREGDIVSGRETGWRMGIEMLRSSPMFGNLEAKIRFDTILIHNYFLRILGSYGLIGALPLMLLYLYLFLFVVRNMLKSPVSEDNVGYYAMMVVLIISLEEPTFPYSPGTGVILPFLLLGHTLFRSDYLCGLYTNGISKR